VYGGVPVDAGDQTSVTAEPVTVAVRVGADGATHPLPTVTITSFDGGLRPHAFCARSRTKKVPGGAWTTKDVASPPRGTDTKVWPGAPPASSWYPSTATVGGDHEKWTGFPPGPCVTAKPLGGAGGALHWSAPAAS
jgi:hypothetical protein